MDYTEFLAANNPYTIRKLTKLLNDISSRGDLCAIAAIGEERYPYVLSLSQHTFRRIKERLDIFDRTVFLHELVFSIESNKNLGEVLDSCVEKIETENEYHKICVYFEDKDWFVYFHLYDDNHIEIATVVSNELVYYADPNATVIFVGNDGKINVDIEKIPCIQFSRNSKYNKKRASA